MTSIATKKRKKWANFTYVGKEVYHITKLFRKKNLGMALKKNIRKILNRNTDKQKCQKHQSGGIYQLQCQDYPLVYTGRFKEHALAYKINYSNSPYAQHLINQCHSLDQMEDIMEVILTTHKGKYLDTVEKYHLYQKTLEGIQINDRSTINENKIFDVIVKHNPR